MNASPERNLFSTTLASPVGELRIAVDDEGRLIRIDFPGPSRLTAAIADSKRCAGVVQQLREYFAGARRTFDLELAPAGTPFQLRVWRELRRIPYGVTISYQDLAVRVGSPKAMRAVGAANGQNPIPIVVPCHRVIGKDGSLTGFGGGLPTKRALLQLEGVALQDAGARVAACAPVLPFAAARHA
jgi:methylated-DNA-[protein]-cysteine S-methyltransferase